MSQYFYSPPFQSLLKSKLTPLEKLVYLAINSWHGYCEFKHQKCLLNSAYIANDLDANINEIHIAIDNLKEKGYIAFNARGCEVVNVSNDGSLLPC